jgi:hypothetical protein
MEVPSEITSPVLYEGPSDFCHVFTRIVKVNKREFVGMLSEGINFVIISKDLQP